MKPFEDFVKERKYLQNVSPRTIDFYWDCQKSVARFGDFSEDGLKKWILGQRENGISATSINSRITGVNAYLRWAGANYKLNPLREQSKISSTYKPEHLKLLLSYKPAGYGDTRLHTLVLTLLDTGLRIDEALSIRLTDVDWDNLLFRVTGKGNKDRLIPFSFELRRVLWRWKEHVRFDLLFGSRNGTKLQRRNVLRDFKALCRDLGFEAVPRSIHALRHTFATNYLRNGGSVFHLQRALGHSTLDMSRRYANLLTEDLQETQQRVSMLQRLR
jgi:integrase/recombinase XerD